jgi:hypothetical protein
MRHKVLKSAAALAKGIAATATAMAFLVGFNAAFAQSDNQPGVRGSGSQEQEKVQPEQRGKTPRAAQERPGAKPSGSEATGGPGKAAQQQTQEERGGATVRGEGRGDATIRSEGPGSKPTGAGSAEKKSEPGTAEKKTDRGDKQMSRESAQGGGSAQLSSEQRTKIRTTIINQRNYRHVDRSSINFSLSIGVAVPRTMYLYPLPATVVEVVPVYRGYLFFIVGDEIVIVHPRTLEIVAILPA